MTTTIATKMAALLILGSFCAACATPQQQGGGSSSATAPAASAAKAEPAPVPAPQRAAEVLDAALASKDLAEHGEALAALGVCARPDALQKLAEEGELRFAAARGLGYLKSQGAAPAIAKAFRKEKGWSVRMELARAAGASGANELVPDLKKACKDENPEVAAAAAFAVVDLGDPTGAQFLIKLGNPERKGAFKDGADRWSRKVLSGQKEGDKALAARTLALYGTREDLPLLEAQLSAADGTLRVWAAAAILKLGR